MPVVVRNDNVLIINTKGGGHAFIGLYLARELMKKGHKVSILNDGDPVWWERLVVLRWLACTSLCTCVLCANIITGQAAIQGAIPDVQLVGRTGCTSHLWRPQKPQHLPPRFIRCMQGVHAAPLVCMHAAAVVAVHDDRCCCASISAISVDA